MTTKIDSPPPYEEAVHHPNPSPGMCPGPPGYWGREGVYPQAGMWSAPGFSPSGMPTTIPTLSAGVPPSNSDMEDLLSTQWESTSIRHAFIRKVRIFIIYHATHTDMRLFVIRYPGIYWASFVVYFLVYCILICCKGPRRRFPWNLVLIILFYVFVLIMKSVFYSYYETKAVFLAMGITAVVCIAVTIFCFQTKVDFTSCGGLLCIAAVLLMIIGIVTAIVLSFQYVPWLHMLYAAIGAIVYTLFLVYNTQLLIGNRELAISPEEYIYGALSLYVDIVHIFLFILQISGAATE
uniref:Transmembrane BAX inhibitor motif containing 1 n=1 Tax=Seriola lalandi dorsalis TaxID=1841481 RepID=A0A3B4YA46_SERLL